MHGQGGEEGAPNCCLNLSSLLETGEGVVVGEEEEGGSVGEDGAAAGAGGTRQGRGAAEPGWWRVGGRPCPKPGGC